MVGLCAGLPIADGADWLFFEDCFSVGNVFGMIVMFAHNALPRAIALGLGRLLLVMYVNFMFVVCLWYVNLCCDVRPGALSPPSIAFTRHPNSLAQFA